MLLTKSNDPKDGVKGGVKEISERQRIILELIIANPFLSAKTISEKTSEKMSEKKCQNVRGLYWIFIAENSALFANAMSEKVKMTDRTIEGDLA